jgi:hypothetical protein
VGSRQWRAEGKDCTFLALRRVINAVEVFQRLAPTTCDHFFLTEILTMPEWVTTANLGILIN